MRSTTNISKPFLLTITLLAGGILSAQADVPSKKTPPMYRYTDEKGALVTGYSISPEYARKGYQIVTITGTVVETVAPEPTAEDRAKIEQDKQNQVSAAKRMEDDKELLLRYNNVDDIQIAKKRKLSEIENKIVILNSNSANIKTQIAAEQQRAAVYERNGQPIPAIQLNKISDLQQSLKATEDQSASRQEELKTESAHFDNDIERLTYLNKNHPKK